MTTNRKPNRPSHTVFMVEGDGDNATWLELGALWPHTKSNGFNLSLKAVPVARDARLVILPYKPKKKEQPNEEAGQ